jgi:hypothetical protein
MDAASGQFDTIDRAIAQFNAGSFRAALLAFEVQWHLDRTAALRSLILGCNALNQLQLGLVTAPRRNLDTALRLLAQVPPLCHGIDMRAWQASLVLVRACIPDHLETGTGTVAWEQVPVPCIQRSVGSFAQ